MIINIINTLLFITIFIISLFLGKFPFSLFISIVAILSLREMIYIRVKNKLAYIGLEIISYISLLFFIMNNYNNNKELFYIDYKLISVILLTNLFTLVIINDKKKYNLLDAFYLCSSTIFMGITYNLFVQIRLLNINYVVYIVVLSLSTYIFEIIFTKFYGKFMFVPTISAKKKLEGVLGGIIMSTIISTIYFISTLTTDIPIIGIVIISFILSIFGQIGDLVFKFIKKEFNKNNFSKTNKLKSGILDIMSYMIFITLGFVLFVSII